jgi:DNA-binding IclR family transcriptional regulator
MAETNAARNPIQAAEITVAILQGLKEIDGGGVTELADHLGMSKSRVHNYLTTLVQEEYVVKEGTTYDVGLRLVGLGTYARHQQEIYAVAKPELERLGDETGDLVNLLVEEYGKGIYLHREQGENAVEVDSYTGHRVHLHNTALGKAIMAELPRERVDEILDRHGLPATTDNTITEREELYERLETIGEEGVAFDDEERLPGLRCVARAITDNDGQVHGAISVSSPSSRMQGSRYREEIPQKLEEVTNIVSLNMSYS